MPSKWQFCNSLFRTISDVATAALATAIVFALMMILAPVRIGLDSQCSLQFSKGYGAGAIQTEPTSKEKYGGSMESAARGLAQ